MTQPRGFDKVTGTFFAFFLLLMTGILFFALSIGPTGVEMSCRRPPAACAIMETYAFGLGRPRVITIAEADIAEARVRRPLPSVGGHHGAPMVVEVVRKDGSAYPAVDYYFQSWARRAADAFNAYLRDPAANRFEMALSAGETLAILAAQAAPFLIFALALAGYALKRRLSSSRARP